MQIVIDIHKEEYEDIIHDEACGLHPLTRAVFKGIVLPEHHSDLIERDALKQRIASVFPMVYGGVASEIDGADTIIPATESEVDNADSD